MGIVTASKLNRLLSKSLPGGLLFVKWLRKEGYSSQLLKKYRDSGWLEGLGRVYDNRAVSYRNLQKSIDTIIRKKSLYL